ncbi:MAG: hypothetical protein ABSB42_00290 [Tepidisphaeraceae bacterium]
MFSVLLAGCAQTEFDAAPAGSGQAIRVGNDQDVRLSDSPLQYRMRADEGHLIVWIENPTDGPIDLIRDKSQVLDPEGIAHPIRGETIAAGSSIKEIFPPLAEPAESAPHGQPEQIAPYDRPGFISIPDSGADSEADRASWQWDDGTEIRVDLTFEQGERQFEQHFVFRRIRK